MGFSGYTDSTTLSGDNDTLLARDASGTQTVEVPAKHATGGMLAHGDAVKAFYRLSLSSSAGISYRKIATLPALSVPGGGIKLRVFVETTSALDAEFEIIINNRASLNEKVLSIRNFSGSYSKYMGIRTYVESDTSLSVYIYHAGVVSVSCTVDLMSYGYGTLATITPPNDVTSTTTPTGTLSLDTTAGKYANGVPDGNEDWNTLTLASGYTGVCRYRKHSSGLVEVQGSFTSLGTTTSGTSITASVLPNGYRPVSYNRAAILNGTISGGAAGNIIITTTGDIKIYNYAASTNDWNFTHIFMAEQ